MTTFIRSALKRLSQSTVPRVKSALAPILPSSPEQKALKADADARKLFRESMDNLMSAPLWTFGAFRHYQERMLELLGGVGFKGWVQRNQKNPLLDRTRRSIAILSAMNPYELASNHKSVFSSESKRLIAEKAGVPVKLVEELIAEHDMLRGDRRWYQIRQQFGRDLPKSAEEREILAQRDRPLSQTEKEVLRDQKAKSIAKQKDTLRLTKPKPIQGLYFRHASKGFDRWRKHTPRTQPCWNKKGLI